MAPYIRGQLGLLGAPSMPTGLSFNLPPSLSPTPARAAPTTPAMTGLLGANPAQARAHAFLKGIGAMAPGLLAAGAPSTDPGAMAKGHAMAAQGFQQGRQGALDRVRAENVQKITMAVAAAKAAREKQLHDIQMQKHAAFSKLLIPTSAQVPTQRLASSAQSPLGANIAKAINLPSSVVKPGVWQSTTTSPVQAQQPPISKLGLSPEMLATIVASDDGPGALQKVLMQRSDPKLEYIDGQLTGFGKVKQEDKLRGELKPVVTAFGNSQRFFNIVEGQLQKKTGTADIAGLNAMIKMIDAGMVTVGEVDLQREAQSIISRIQGTIAQFKGGRLLDSEKDALRTNMRATAKDLLASMHSAHERSVMGYKGIADRRQLDWNNIWTMKGVFKDKAKTTGNGNNATLNPRPNSNSIGSKVPNLESTEPG
tara:strand:- start:474 stop:1745 length:1272 start_codon:yes stop_codon:yes gene_type:complete